MSGLNETLSRVPQDKIVLVHREGDFGHADFTWSRYAPAHVYPAVVDALRSFAPGHAGAL